MPIYEESDHLIRNAKSNLKHVVNHAYKPSENFVSNEASGDHHDRKAYVRTMESEYEGNGGKRASSLGVSGSQDINYLKEHEVPLRENISLEAVEAHAMVHDSDSKMQLASNAVNNAGSNDIVPQTFTPATDKLALGTSESTAATMSHHDKKHAYMSKTDLAGLVRKAKANVNLEWRKPLQPENTRHIDGEDASSIISSAVPSVKAFKGRTTPASAPTFRVSVRAEKWKEFYSKLEEKQQALEAERTVYEARKKEQEETSLKELRKSLNFKATPMPSFYHKEPPPKPELKKAPSTRAKSPTFSRRKRCNDVYDRHQNNDTKNANKSRSKSAKNRTTSCKAEKNHEILKSPSEHSKPNCANEADPKTAADPAMQS